MICEECGVNQANIRLITVSDGVRHERNLCTACMAKNKRIGFSMNFSSLVGLLGGILQAAGSSNEAEEGEIPQIECPTCAQSYKTFRETGYLGCPDCYKAFREPLEALLKRVHGSVQHTGRVPGGLRGGVAMKLRIDGMKQRLVRAIAAEEYEEAALLRDQIRALSRDMERLEMAAKGEGDQDA